MKDFRFWLSTNEPTLPIFPRLDFVSPVVRGRWVGAIFALAAGENRDGPERDLSSGFCVPPNVEIAKTNPLRAPRMCSVNAPRLHERSQNPEERCGFSRRRWHAQHPHLRVTLVAKPRATTAPTLILRFDSTPFRLSGFALSRGKMRERNRTENAKTNSLAVQENKPRSTASMLCF
jgi:hypothetical protein